MEHLINLLPAIYRDKLRENELAGLEEIRLRTGQPLILKIADKEQKVLPLISQEQIEDCIRCACRQSVYAFTDTIRQGFITIEGGHRIGICGFGVSEDQEIKTIKQPSSLLIRCAREIRGCASKIGDSIQDSALIVGPPCSGKTTFLRDLVRYISDIKRQNVGLADERGELAASYHGAHQLNVGMRTDVITNIPKATAAMMLLRTMNPDWIAMDEITAKSDMTVLDQISYSGVKVLATVHAGSMEELYLRPEFDRILSSGIFANVIEMRKDKTCIIREVT